MMMLTTVIAALAISPPAVPDAFSAGINYSVPGVISSLVGNYWFDKNNSRQCIKTHSISNLTPKDKIGTPGEWANMTEYIMSDGVYYGVNSLPKEIMTMKEFPDQFAFVPYSHYNGTNVVGGKNVTIWDYRPNNKTHMQYYSQVDTNIPVGLFSNVTQQNLPGQPATRTVTLMVFSDVVTTNVDFSVFKNFNKTKIDNPPTCNDRNSKPIVKDMDVYVFHPSNEWNISGQDVADLIGDTYFVCFDSTNTQRDHYQYISKYSLSVNTNWGQYRMCNDYPPKCVGTENFFIGREASGALGPDQAGQCAENTETGSWYSLPSKGECQGDDTPQSGNCTWKINKRIKTINAKCMLDRGLVAACLVDKRLPFATGGRIFSTSFDDGVVGCPAISPPSSF